MSQQVKLEKSTCRDLKKYNLNDPPKMVYRSTGDGQLMKNKEEIQKLYIEWQKESSEIIETAKNTSEARERAKKTDNKYKKKIESLLPE